MLKDKWSFITNSVLLLDSGKCSKLFIINEEGEYA